MTSPIGFNTIMTRSGEPSAKDPERIATSAQEFEAMLIAQMLKSARESGSGDWAGSSEDQSGAPMSEMAEQQFAQLMAQNGGIGLAKLVANGLNRKE